MGFCRFLKIMGWFSHFPWPLHSCSFACTNTSGSQAAQGSSAQGTHTASWQSCTHGGFPHKTIRFSKFQVNCPAPKPSPTFQLASQRCWKWRDWIEVVEMNVVRSKQQRDRKHENIHGQHETNTAFNLQTLHMHRNPAFNKHAELQKKKN